MSKRTLEAFFSPPKKRPKAEISSLARTASPPFQRGNHTVADAVQAHDSGDAVPETLRRTTHETWAFPIVDLPARVSEELEELLLTASGREIRNQPHLDILYFQPLIPPSAASDLFRYLRASLPFYRVNYQITRFGKSIDINTPRFTTVFGIDESSRFVTTTSQDDNDASLTRLSTRIVEANHPGKDGAPGKYKSCVVPPRPIPPALAMLKTLTEALMNDTYNFVLVNYYSSGQDSISFHSDDERFLGTNPTIASFSLGARRDFLMKHKPPGPGPSSGNKGQVKVDSSSNDKTYPGTTQIKLPLASGDVIIMRGETQRNWLHSIPKRSGKNNEADRGRINITMRKAMVPAGTENYYQYNVGTGPVYKWNEQKGAMEQWKQ